MTMQMMTFSLGEVTLSDEDREAIGPMIRKDGRLPSAEECATFIRLHGMRGVDLAAGAEVDD
jgi:hypothetical protein